MRFKKFKNFTVSISADEKGYIGRQCPNILCKKYFKVIFGTGIQKEIPCICPYCGHSADHQQFYSSDQFNYINSIRENKINDYVADIFNDFSKSLHKSFPKGGPIEMTTKSTIKRHRIRIRHYKEKELETEIVCEQCGLHYAVYGVFAYCPDCKTHNSIQILNKNLDIAVKYLERSKEQSDIAEEDIRNSLKKAVEAFDGFGREITRVHSNRKEGISFQNLKGARNNVKTEFNIDIADAITKDEWDFARKYFQRRHLIEHRSGVVDQKYLDETADFNAILGRKVPIEYDEVHSLISILIKIGSYLSNNIIRTSDFDKR